MKRLLTLALLAGLVGFAGCGDDGTCGVTGMGAKLCDGDAAAWCDIVDGYESDDPDTSEFCNKLADEGY